MNFYHDVMQTALRDIYNTWLSFSSYLIHLYEVWASYQIRKIVGWACAWNAGNVFPNTAVSDPDMHHGTCVTRVTWCMPGSLTSGFLWSRWWGKHSQRMHNLQFYVSGKRPMRHKISTQVGYVFYSKLIFKNILKKTAGNRTVTYCPYPFSTYINGSVHDW